MFILENEEKAVVRSTISTIAIWMDGLVQDCSNFSANALELLQSCAKPSHYLSYYAFKSIKLTYR